MRRIILGATDGYHYQQLDLWVRSIRRHAPAAEIVLITYAIDRETWDACHAAGIKLIPGHAVGPHCVVKRFGDYAELLATLAADDLVILSDVGDVVFQDDPFPPLAELLGDHHDIVVQEEPQFYANGDQTIRDGIREWYPYFSEKLMPYRVICAGVVGGNAGGLEKLCNVIFTAARHASCKPRNLRTLLGPDQDALNMLARLGTWRDRIRIVLPFASWCYNAGTQHVWPAIFERDNPGAAVEMIDGYAINRETNRPYPILHLYNKSPEWKREIWQRIMAPHETWLCRLARKYRTDKTPSVLHSYTPYYDLILQGKPVHRVLEIGIGYLEDMPHIEEYAAGASLRMWRDYFPRAEIVGIDCDPRAMVNEDRITSYRCNTTSGKEWRSRLPDLGFESWQLVTGEWRTCDTQPGVKFDFIVDDGSHAPEDQIATTRHAMPLLASDGIYIIEDVGEPEIVTKGLAALGYRCEVHEFNITKRSDDRLVRVYPI